MLGREARTVLLIMGMATASLTSLTLPAARAVVATLPSPQSGESPSSSSLRQMVERSHARFGELAADLACSYLKKFAGPKSAPVPVNEETAHWQIETLPAEGVAEVYALAAQR